MVYQLNGENSYNKILIQTYKMKVICAIQWWSVKQTY